LKSHGFTSDEYGGAADEAVQPNFHSQLSHELFLLYEI